MAQIQMAIAQCWQENQNAVRNEGTQGSIRMSQLEKVSLDNLAEAVTVAHVGPTSAFFTDHGVPFFRTGNVGDRRLILEDLRQITPEFHQKLRKSTLKCGDIMVSRVVSDRITCAIVPSEFDGANCGNVIVIRPGKNIVSEYLAHLISTPASQRQLLQRQVGSAQAVVNTSVLKAWEIPLPPIAEQKRIAAILDKAEELRGLRRKALEELDAIVQSIFLEMFGDPATNPKGWKRIRFSDLLAAIESGRSPNCLDRPVEGEEWGVLKLGAVTWCEYKPLENKALPPNEKPDLSFEVKPGDLLFTRKNTFELVAACALVRSTPPRLLLPDLIFRFRTKANAPINLSFLHQLLINPAKRREIQKLASGSASSMPNISKAKLEAVLIEAPPLHLQEEFARRVEAIEQFKATHRESLNQLDALFASLQHRAFRGEL